jgi:4-hydroxy-tetrahydrodipicolinate synthase
VSLEALERLAAAGTVAGVKDSTGKAERLTALLERFRDRLTVFAASDAMALKARKMGADGFISALANSFPRAFVRLWDRAGADPSDPEAAALQSAIDRVRGGVKGYGGIAALKHLLARRGFQFHDTRLPFQDLNETAKGELDRLMEQVGEME